MLTREEIAAMPAGFELNVLVAERVLGHRWLYYNRYPGEYVRFMVSPSLLPDLLKEYDLWLPGTSPEARIIPAQHVLSFATQGYDFSNDVKDAWRVVEFMNGTHYYEQSNRWLFGGSDGGQLGFVAQFRRFKTHHGDNKAVAETAPLAICRASLLALL